MKYKVAQIIPYFGKWPEWIELYFYSCSRNPNIDFIFYTDCPLPKQQYPNTIFHQCSYQRYSQIVSTTIVKSLINSPTLNHSSESSMNRSLEITTSGVWEI